MTDEDVKPPGEPPGDDEPGKWIEKLRQEFGATASSDKIGESPPPEPSEPGAEEPWTSPPEAPAREAPAGDPPSPETALREAAPGPGEPDPTLDDVVASIDREVGEVGLESEAAAPMVAPRAAREIGSRHIVFTLAETRYAVAIGNVVEIGSVPDITHVPNVPDWVRGVSNLRGEIFAVLDFRLFLGFEALGRPDQRRMLVVRAGEEEATAGLVVDEVNGVTGLSAAELAPPAAPVQDRLAPYLLGVMEHQDRLLAVLDMEKLLRSPEIRQFELQ